MIVFFLSIRSEQNICPRYEFAFLLQILIVGHYHINVVSLVNTAKVKANGAR